MAKCDLAEIRAMIEGPVNSIPTPFLVDGAVDREGVAEIVEIGIAGGSKVSLLTYGDSQFDFLGDDEVADLTKLVVETARGRGITVAATKRWPDKWSVEFARYCVEIGVDMLMVLPSDFCPAAGRIGQYRAVAAEIPVMLVGCPPRSVIDAVIDIPNICSFKEDGTEAYAVEMMNRYGDRFSWVTGGQLWRHYTQIPYGCRAWMCWLAALAPDISRRYAEAVRCGNLVAAGKVVKEVEAPFFALAEDVGGGWPALWRAALELAGVSARYLRPPMVSATDAEIAKIAEKIRALGIAR